MIDIKNYNKNNIFAKILRNDVPSTKIYENKYIYAFKDISPKAAVHVLIIPKSEYCSFHDFSEKASPKEQAIFYKSIREIALMLKISKGYRLITNVGAGGGKRFRTSIFTFYPRKINLYHLISIKTGTWSDGLGSSR